jgi:hypothetical protein
MTFDNISINSIQKTFDGPNGGGISDFGNFAEGFCCKIKTEMPFYSYIICLESAKEKEDFIDIIKRLKFEKQGTAMSSIPVPKVIETITATLNPHPQIQVNMKSSNGTITDGQWIVLQDWSQCDRACGGGKSTQHRVCMPPKNGGRPCNGEPILTKPCNEHPCPGTTVNGLQPSNNNTLTLKPIVKVLQFSTRPQRYTKCVIKESDLMYIKAENSVNNPLIQSDKGEILEIPTRTVMNNRTVTIFGGEDYSTMIETFSLKDTTISKSKRRSNCFVLSQTQKKRAELCPFANTDIKSIQEWDYDFNLFKNQCQNHQDVIQINQSELDAKLKQEMDKAKQNLLIEREKQIKNKVEEQEVKKAEEVITSSNKVALQAIQKELSLEQMIKQEEDEMEEREEKEILFQIEQEKQKKDCITQRIKEKALESQFNLRAKEAENEAKRIKEETAKQIIAKRNKLNEMIKKQKDQAKRKKAQLKQKLLNVRYEIANEMTKANKRGESIKCQKAIESAAERKNYCSAAFSEDYASNVTCNEGELNEFCTMCCDNEFGEFYENDRNDCYNKICSPTKGIKVEGTQVVTDGVLMPNTMGRWVWQESLSPKA